METMKHTLHTTSAEETRQLGLRLGALLQPGDFVGLQGELGAGKTHFVRGVAEGAGVDPEHISSPTYAIVHPYEGRLTLHHADLYRLQSYPELYATGLLDCIGPDSAMVVEWIDRIPETAPATWLRLHLTATAPEARVLLAEAFGVRAEQLLRLWVERVT